ncbi:polygalacturonase-like [Chenopodium quinoa]|uniref:polygalacturonase-like n=1 Tax=Chenopodium quinoa TaxID=63459 RepID=UPI000B787726|nr:polygalacturonase-like [Chenopodium quinoa]
MALQLYHMFPLFIIIVLHLSSSSCYGRYIQFFGTKQGLNHSYSADNNIVQQKHSGGHVDNVRRALRTATKTFNVADYGAKGDGKADDTQAFQKAWKEACSFSGAIFMVPSNKNYLLKPITFSGPCKSAITMQISGTILASEDRSVYEEDARLWLVIKKVNSLSVKGGGVIDGNGKTWWKNSCKINKKLPCKHAPTALTFENCKNLAVKNLNIQNAQQMHVSFQECNNVKVSSLKVTSPEDSPNTDAIHITGTQNIQITKSNVGTGDDCISIVSGSQKVRVTDFTCGPGHGISIGSLGDQNSEAHVSDVIVNGATLTGTTNGLRIKTWEGGSGVASNIVFQNIMLSNVKNPIIIDQEYCDQATPCKKQASAVRVKNVVYQNIKGTSSSEKAVVFDCSENYPCEGITMENIEIDGIDGGKSTEATCNNVKISKVEDVFPQCSTT